MKKNVILLFGLLVSCFLWWNALPTVAAPSDKYLPEPGPSLELILIQSNRTLLKAIATNHTSRSMIFVHNQTLQSSELILRDKLGAVINPFDSRSRKKFDNSVFESSYVSIPAHGWLVLYEEAFAPSAGGTFSFHWGPYEYDTLKPGTYNAQVVFQSTIDWIDKAGGKPRRHPAGVWVGQTRSNFINFELMRARPPADGPLR